MKFHYFAKSSTSITSAASLGKQATNGSLEVGKNGDLLILNAPRWEHLVYQMGDYQNLIAAVIKRGQVITPEN